MKNIKSILIYAIILVLCIAAFAGVLFKGGSSKQASVPQATQTAQSVTESSAASATENPKPVESVAESSAASATENPKPVVLPANVNITGKSDADRQKHVEEVMKKAEAEPDPNPVVGIGTGEDYEKTTLTAIENAGGLEGIVKEGDIVLIKPNICGVMEAGNCMTTDYRVIKTVVEQVKKYGASRVIIADGPIFGLAFRGNSIEKMKFNEISGVDYFEFNNCIVSDCYKLKPQISLTTKAIYIPKLYMDADVVINIAKMKTHQIPDACVSLCLKNVYGVPPLMIYGSGDKSGLHMLGLVNSVIDINRIRKPDFFIIDGIVGGEGYGPLQNTPVQSDIIIAGKDPVAVDTVGLTFMGFKLNNSPIVKKAGEQGLGISDISKINIKGAVIDDIKMNFSR